MEVIPMTAICSHLELIQVDPPDEVAGCEDCLRIGGRWLHLRACRTCGHVGCCDKAKNQHALKHFEATGHPIVRPYRERGMDWLWCYVDKALLDRI